MSNVLDILLLLRSQRRRYYYLRCHFCDAVEPAIVGEKRSLVPVGWTLVPAAYYVVDDQYQLHGMVWSCRRCTRNRQVRCPT